MRESGWRRLSRRSDNPAPGRETRAGRRGCRRGRPQGHPDTGHPNDCATQCVREVESTIGAAMADFASARSCREWTTGSLIEERSDPGDARYAMPSIMRVPQARLPALPTWGPLIMKGDSSLVDQLEAVEQSNVALKGTGGRRPPARPARHGHRDHKPRIRRRHPLRPLGAPESQGLGQQRTRS